MKDFIIEVGCISVGVWAEGEETVQHKAKSIANVEYQHLRDTDCYSHAYNMSVMSDRKSTAKVQRNVSGFVCVLKVHSIFAGSTHEFNIHGQ